MVYVDGNSYIIYYLLFCCWIYVRSMGRVFITSFFFSGMLCEGDFALHSIALECLWGIKPWSLLYPKSQQGPYLALHHEYPVLLLVLSKTSCVDLFSSSSNNYFGTSVSVVIIPSTEEWKEICVMNAGEQLAQFLDSFGRIFLLRWWLVAALGHKAWCHY